MIVLSIDSGVVYTLLEVVFVDVEAGGELGGSGVKSARLISDHSCVSIDIFSHIISVQNSYTLQVPAV